MSNHPGQGPQWSRQDPGPVQEWIRQNSLLAALVMVGRQGAPGIRITTADLRPEEAGRLADALAGLGRAPAATYAG